MRSLVFVALLLCACGAKFPPVDEVVLCDRSSSAAVCDEPAVRQAAMAFLDGSPQPGSRFELVVVGCATDDVARLYAIEVPGRWGRGAVRKRRRWYEEERQRLERLELPAVNRCSAIAAGIWRGSRILAERPGTERRLVVISDLREVDRSLGINFERKVPAPGEFVRKLRSAELLGELSTVKTTICGVHDRATPDAPAWTARRAQQLRLAWNEALTAMGAPGVPLTETCDFGNVHVQVLASQVGR